MSSHFERLIREMGQKAQKATRQLGHADTSHKNDALLKAADALRDSQQQLLDGNARDIETAKAANKSDAFIDRLSLSEARIDAIIGAVEGITALPDPVGRVLNTTTRPNGLKISRVSCPIGVIAMIYEARPNVAADAGALCAKAGSAVILRGGSDSLHSSRIIVDCLRSGFGAAGLPEDAVQLVQTPDRAAVSALLQCTDYIDLVIPRGGRSLVERVRHEAKVPTLLHLDGNCHTYIHDQADIDMATTVVANAKMRRTGICGATESIVIDHQMANKALPALVDALVGCEIRGDNAAQEIDHRILVATDDDWQTEYLDSIVSVKVVSDLDEALRFITENSSGHTDAIITENPGAAERFLNEIDSAVVMHNTSTQFSDGGEFGMGAEIGIATGKLHARGPVGLDQLTTFKYKVEGTGQVRP
ncbi:MAG: glutamate-5-semialdehyde dehydrogenase [Pseudomonadota bacterium]